MLSTMLKLHKCRLCFNQKSAFWVETRPPLTRPGKKFPNGSKGIWDSDGAFDFEYGSYSSCSPTTTANTYKNVSVQTPPRQPCHMTSRFEGEPCSFVIEGNDKVIRELKGNGTKCFAAFGINFMVKWFDYRRCFLATQVLNGSESA